MFYSWCIDELNVSPVVRHRAEEETSMCKNSQTTLYMLMYKCKHTHTSLKVSDTPTLPFAYLFIEVSVVELECPLKSV